MVPGEIEVLLRQAKALAERIDSGAAPAAGAGDEEAEGLADWRHDGSYRISSIRRGQGVLNNRPQRWL